MRIACLQIQIAEREKNEAVSHVMDLLNTVVGADLIVLPELWATGYFSFHKYRNDREAMGGRILSAMRKKAADSKAHLLIGSMVAEDGGGLFNSSYLLAPNGNSIARYNKVHLFGYESEEKKILMPGTDVVVAETPLGKMGLSICFDLRFPQLYWEMAGMGAEIFLIASAWPKLRLDAFRLFNRARAHENLAFVISCNCAGISEGRELAGHSLVVDPMGNILAEAGEEEEILYADIDPTIVKEARENFGFPVGQNQPPLST